MTFWRQVFVWDLNAQRWNVRHDERYDGFESFECVFGNPNFENFSWCMQPQPYIYERWWKFIPSTIGTGYGTWSYLGGRINWGANPVVN